MILFFFMGGGDMFAQRPRNVGRLPLFFLSNIACTVEDCGLGGTSQCSSGLRPRHTSIPSLLISSTFFLQFFKGMTYCYMGINKIKQLLLFTEKLDSTCTYSLLFRSLWQICILDSEMWCQAQLRFLLMLMEKVGPSCRKTFANQSKLPLLHSIIC